MRKTVFKSAGITIAIIFAAIFVTISIISVFAPKTMANFNKKLGNEKLAIFYLEESYKKTDSIYDLRDLLDIVNTNGSNAKRIKYGREMLNRADFSSFSKKTDEKSNFPISYKNYVVGNYVCALFKASKKTEALETAEEMTVVYDKGNAYSRLITAARKDKEFLTLLKGKIESFDGAGTSYLDEDIALINELLAN